MSLRGDVKYYNKCYGYYSHFSYFSLYFYFTFKGRLVFFNSFNSFRVLSLSLYIHHFLCIVAVLLL